MCRVGRGIKSFDANSDGETVEIPRYYRKAEKRLNRLNRKKSKKFRKGQPQSNNYQKAKEIC
jgi:transposase